LIYLGPVIVIGIMIAMIFMVALNWREIGAAIGIKIAQKRKRKMRKQGSRYSVFVWLALWMIAIVVLLERPGSIFNPKGMNTNSTLASIQGDATVPSNPFGLAGILPNISSLVQNGWFSIAFLGLLVVGGLVLVQSARVAMKEISEMNIQELHTRRAEGLQATQDAIKLVDEVALDPRSRIINCFQLLVSAVSRLGVPVSSDQTARELERAIRSTFALDGSAANELTQLFEEARYSIHDINDEDAARARQHLESIADELKVQLDK